MKITKQIKSWYGIIATFFCAGCLPKCPGTFGSIAACALWIAFRGIPWQIILLTFALGVVAADKYERQSAKKDPGEVVVDEVVGYWISAYGFDMSLAIVALVLFRIVDILKPFPVKTAEKLPGGIGIMADDIIGGIMVNILLHVLCRFL